MIIFRRGIPILIMSVLLIAGGCAHRVQEGGDMIRYEKALAETDPAKVAGLQPGSNWRKKRLRALWIFTGSFPQR